jgi:hypothetical protein
MSKAPNWQVIENVVAAIENARNRLPGMKVTQKAQLPRIPKPTELRDVDVLVELPVGGRMMTIAVEVKATKRRISMEEMGSIVDLRRDIAVDRFCVVSVAGFTKGARSKAEEHNIDITTLSQLESSEIFAYPPEVTIRRTGGELLSVRFLFNEETLRRDGDRLRIALTDVRHDDVMLTDSTGTVPLPLFLTAMLHEQGQEVLARLQHGDVFPFVVDLRQRIALTMSVKGETMPGPESLEVVAKLSRTTETVPEQRFQLGDIQMTTSAMNLRGETEQVSLVWVPQSDGTTQLVLSRGPIKPKKVRRTMPSGRGAK